LGYNQQITKKIQKIIGSILGSRSKFGSTEKCPYLVKITNKIILKFQEHAISSPVLSS
jgi:hypothetical protein